MQAVRSIEERLGKRFGDATHPLLLSIRSGRRVSMPGMMDTLLNVGLNERSVAGSPTSTGTSASRSMRTAACFRCTGRSCAVSEPTASSTYSATSRPNSATRACWTPSCPRQRSRASSRSYLNVIEEASGAPFPQDVNAQLWDSIGAVFVSWDNRESDSIPTHARDRQRRQHRMHGPGDGLRQHRPSKRIGRGVHAKPVERRQAAVRRVPAQRPGRGRRRGASHAGGADGRAAHAGQGGIEPRGFACRRPSRRSLGTARPSKHTSATCRTSSSRSRMATRTCCRLALRSERPGRRSASRSTWCSEGVLTKEEASAASGRSLARTTAPSTASEPDRS